MAKFMIRETCVYHGFACKNLCLGQHHDECCNGTFLFQISAFQKHFDDQIYNYGYQVIVNLVSSVENIYGHIDKLWL